MLLALVVAQIAVAGQTTLDTATYPTPALRVLVTEASHLNARVPPSFGRYRASVESEISYGNQADEREMAVSLEQIASTLTWTRTGEFEQHARRPRRPRWIAPRRGSSRSSSARRSDRPPFPAAPLGCAAGRTAGRPVARRRNGVCSGAQPVWPRKCSSDPDRDHSQQHRDRHRCRYGDRIAVRKEADERRRAGKGGRSIKRPVTEIAGHLIRHDVAEDSAAGTRDNAEQDCHNCGLLRFESECATVGPVDAETVNGTVDVRMTTLGDTGAIRAVTTNGTAVAYVPEITDGRIETSTINGRIGTDFGSIPAARNGNRAREFETSIGLGTREYVVQSLNGSAWLRLINADGTVKVAESDEVRVEVAAPKAETGRPGTGRQPRNPR